MTTIDVNTGGFVGGRSFDDTIFKTNLEAAQVIARQLRLRNLGGIIIIDFIDMENADHRSAVLAELNRALERDRTRLTVNGFTQLGLVEMTRKRTRESLAHVLCEPCPTCTGRGELKTAQTICYEILREILREARQFNAREFRILAAQPVIDLFLDEESQSLAQLGDFIGKPISLQVESIYTQEQYDIVLDLTEANGPRCGRTRVGSWEIVMPQSLRLRPDLRRARDLPVALARSPRWRPSPWASGLALRRPRAARSAHACARPLGAGAKIAWRGGSRCRRGSPATRVSPLLPAGWSRWRRAPLVVFCHGCKQTPEEFAQGTRIAALADAWAGSC